MTLLQDIKSKQSGTGEDSPTLIDRIRERRRTATERFSPTLPSLPSEEDVSRQAKKGEISSLVNRIRGRLAGISPEGISPTEMPVRRGFGEFLEAEPKGIATPPRIDIPRPPEPLEEDPETFGLRPDGTKKGKGFLGSLRMKDGSGMTTTEQSITVDIDGKDTLIPAIIPTLNKKELEFLLRKPQGELPPSIINKAIKHAEKRISKGQSPFAGGEPIKQKPPLDRFLLKKEDDPFVSTPRKSQAERADFIGKVLGIQRSPELEAGLRSRDFGKLDVFQLFGYTRQIMEQVVPQIPEEVQGDVSLPIFLMTGQTGISTRDVKVLRRTIGIESAEILAEMSTPEAIELGAVIGVGIDLLKLGLRSAKGFASNIISKVKGKTLLPDIIDAVSQEVAVRAKQTGKSQKNVFTDIANELRGRAVDIRTPGAAARPTKEQLSERARFAVEARKVSRGVEASEKLEETLTAKRKAEQEARLKKELGDVEKDIKEATKQTTKQAGRKEVVKAGKKLQDELEIVKKEIEQAIADTRKIDIAEGRKIQLKQEGQKKPPSVGGAPTRTVKGEVIPSLEISGLSDIGKLSRDIKRQVFAGKGLTLKVGKVGITVPPKPTAEKVIADVRKRAEAKGLPKGKIDKLVKALKSEAGFADISRKKPEFTGGAKSFADAVETSKISSKQRSKTTFAKMKKNLNTAIVDVSGNTKRALLKAGPEGKRAVMKHDLIGGAHAKAIRDTNAAEVAVYGGLPKFERDHLDIFINAKRVIEVSKNKGETFKFQKGFTAKNAADSIGQVPKDVLPIIEERAKTYWKVMDEQISQLKTEGLLTAEALKGLRQAGRNFSPRRVLDWVDPPRGGSGKIIKVPDSGLKSLTEEGSLKLIETDTSLLLSETINRTQTRIFRNRANVALYDFAKANPDNTIVKIVKPKGKTKAGRITFPATPAGFEDITVMVKGQVNHMIMPHEIAKEWVLRDPILNPQVANWLSWISGSKILKASATGLNPEFAVTNIPRDIAHILLTTDEFSSVLPIGLAQIAKEITKVIPDAVLRKGRYNSYINEGGGMEFLTHQGKFTRKSVGVLGDVQTVLGYIGETSEIIGRLALRERAIKNGASPEEATWVARNFLDFSQGGNFIKAADSFIPYLNAATQGSRGIFRAAEQKPKLFAFKAAQIMAVATGLYLANRYTNQEALEQVSERDKINNFIITTPFSFKDKEGNRRWIYFKIAKDQGQRIMASIAENLMKKYLGEPVDVDEITKSIADFLPIVPSNLLPPAFEAIMGYMVNKDFWLNRDIWRGPHLITQSEEFTNYTHPTFVKIGELTGLSPTRVKFALQKLFTSGNPYTSTVEVVMKRIFGAQSQATKDMVTEELILRKPFIRRVVNTTRPFTKHEKELEKAKLQAQTDRFVKNREFDKVSQSFYDGKTTIDAVKNFVKGMSIDDRRRLVQRHRRRGKLQDITDKRYWLELAEVPTVARANVFWNRWRTSTKEQRVDLEKNVRIVPGIATEKFVEKFNYLRSLSKKEEAKQGK